MSAKLPRRSFAAPLVVTLAMPACFVSTGKAPPPSHGTSSDAPANDEPRAHVNPPRPVEHPGHAEPAQPKDPQPGNDTAQQTQQQTPPPAARTRTWTVYVQASGKSQECFAAYDVECPPKGATCNPPPPIKLASCPSGITAAKPYKIREDAPDSCALYYPMPDCPAGVACNPPRPQTVSCPTH